MKGRSMSEIGSAIEYLRGYLISDVYSDNCIRFHKMAIEALSEKLNNSWIQCSERMPENQPSYISGTDYYVTLCSGVVRSAKYKECKWIGVFGKLYSDNEVVAWQENKAPESYKGEE